MTDKVELIKAKVEEKINLYERLLNAGKGGGAGLMSKIVALQGVLIDINFIQMDSLPEEPVSRCLEEAAKENAKIERSDDTEVGYDINRFGGFIDGAKWDRNHILSKIDVNAMLADYQAEVGINNYVQIYSKGIEAVLKKIKEL